MKIVCVIYTSAMNGFCCQTNRFLHYMPKWKVSILEHISIDSMLEDISIDTHFSMNNETHIIFLLHE